VKFKIIKRSKLKKFKKTDESTLNSLAFIENVCKINLAIIDAIRKGKSSVKFTELEEGKHSTNITKLDCSYFSELEDDFMDAAGYSYFDIEGSSGSYPTLVISWD
jgi:hypothetical protein